MYKIFFTAVPRKNEEKRIREKCGERGAAAAVCCAALALANNFFEYGARVKKQKAKRAKRNNNEL